MEPAEPLTDDRLPAMRFGRVDRPGPRRGSPGRLDPSQGPRTPVVGRAFDRVFRNEDTGEVVIAQMPNLPLGLFLAATTIRVLLDPSGTLGTAIAIVGAVALAWWAGAEILRGESLFRRILGGVVLVAMVAGRLMH